MGITAIVLMVASAVLSIPLVANYQPLLPGSTGWTGVYGTQWTATPQTWSDDLPDGATVIAVPVKKGLTFRYRFSLRNGGPIAVQIRDIRFGQAGSGFTAEAMEIQTDDPHARPWRPMRPFTLGPHDEAGVEMLVHVTSCLPEAGELSWNRVPVQFRVFGIHRWDFVQTNIQIVLRGTERC